MLLRLFLGALAIAAGTAGGLALGGVDRTTRAEPTPLETTAAPTPLRAPGLAQVAELPAEAPPAPVPVPVPALPEEEEAP